VQYTDFCQALQTPNLEI